MAKKSRKKDGGFKVDSTGVLVIGLAAAGYYAFKKLTTFGECTIGDTKTVDCLGRTVTTHNCINSWGVGKWVEVGKCQPLPEIEVSIQQPSIDDTVLAPYPHNCYATVRNTGASPAEIYVGFTNESLDVATPADDRPTIKMSLNPGEQRQVNWLFGPLSLATPRYPGDRAYPYRITVSAWDVNPYPGCEASGACTRCGTAVIDYEFTYTGTQL